MFTVTLNIAVSVHVLGGIHKFRPSNVSLLKLYLKKAAVF